MSFDEHIAQQFHEAYEQLAFEHGYSTRKASRVPWEQVPANNRALMVDTVNHLLRKEIISPGPKCPGVNPDTPG